MVSSVTLTAKSNCHALNCRVYGDAHYMEIWC